MLEDRFLDGVLLLGFQPLAIVSNSASTRRPERLPVTLLASVNSLPCYRSHQPPAGGSTQEDCHGDVAKLVERRRH